MSDPYDPGPKGTGTVIALVVVVGAFAALLLAAWLGGRL